MKFLVDAHLPERIGSFFEELGHEVVHTSRLEDGNASSDQKIILVALEKDAVVITKDHDFYHSFQLRHEPRKLVLVKVGNLRLAGIKALFQAQAAQIITLLHEHDFVEVYPDRLIAV